MLDLPHYLLGVVEVLAVAGFATWGATAIRLRLLPSFEGAPAHLATAVLALALLIWPAELLGSLGLFESIPYLVGVAGVGLGIRVGVGGGWGHPSRWLGFSPDESAAGRGRGRRAATIVGLAIVGIAVVKFAAEVKLKLGTGMTGFDSTWYHGAFAAGFFQSGNTWELHYIAPQFLAWFYPANSELFHGFGMLAFDRDILSPLLNLGWLVGCLVACWCIGRPFGVAPWSMALGAVALSVPAFADQAGEARNDIVGTFFLLAAVAIALNAHRERIEASSFAVAALSAGLAAGTKLNFLLPAAVLVVGLALVSPAGIRLRSLVVGGLAALAGGGYWYLRNLAHSGNPLPWFDGLGPLSLPAPDQALGGREGHSVLGYLFDGRVWSDWFLPGLHDGLWIIWPLLLALGVGGLVLCAARRSDPVLRIAAFAGLAAALAWLLAPTSASGPEGMPRGFESGLRYLVPALVLGLAILPPVLLPRVARWRGEGRRDRTRGPLAAGALALVVAIAFGYPVQRHYLQDRYLEPTFAAPGLNLAFDWAGSISGARIATTSTRQYPLFGTDLTNHVQYVGIEQPHGGFTAPTTCPGWRRLLNEGDYDYVVATRDRIESGKPPYPSTARWTEGAGAVRVLREPPTIVFRLTGSLDLTGCRY